MNELYGYETTRLYQQIAAQLKRFIKAKIYRIGDKLPAERQLAEEMRVSRTVVREALIMLEVEGYVDVRKGSGIHIISDTPTTLLKDSFNNNNLDSENLNGNGLLGNFSMVGPFELLQARQLIESNIAEFAAMQITKHDISVLLDIHEHSQNEDRGRDSTWDLKFHVAVAASTQNSAMATLVEMMWEQRINNPYWLKLHEHISEENMKSWCDDHNEILKSLIRRDPKASKMAMWQHLENTKQMLFHATTDEFDIDKYMFNENPVVHLPFTKSK